jgi:hypothetical protein
VNFYLGQRYERPGVSASSWFAEALGEVRQERMPPVPVELEFVGGGGSVSGNIDYVDPGSPNEEHGAIVLEHGEHVRCEDIAAFTLLPDPPPDVSDELRG